MYPFFIYFIVIIIEILLFESNTSHKSVTKNKHINQLTDFYPSLFQMKNKLFFYKFINSNKLIRPKYYQNCYKKYASKHEIFFSIHKCTRDIIIIS